MPDAPTRSQLFEVGANEILVRAENRPVGDRLSAQEIFTPGSDINILLAGSSAMAEEVARADNRNISNLTLDGAQGEDLDRVVRDIYEDLPRLTASAARVSLQFTRTSTAAGPVTQLTGSVVQTTGGVRFETLADAAFQAVEVGPVNVDAVAVEAGESGNVAANTITGFVTAPVDSTLVVTNPNFAAGGDSTETDQRYRARARAYPSQLRRGTLGAIEFGALTVAGVRQATAEEPLNNQGWPSGYVVVYIADANGQSNESLNTLVENALREYAGGGVPVDVFGAVPTYVAIEYALSYQTGVDTSAAFNSVVQATVANVNSLGPNETLRRSLLFEVARSVSGTIVSNDAVVVPTGDVVPTQGQIIRTRSDLVTPS